MPRYIDAELIDFGKVFVGDSDFATDCRNYANDAVDAVHTADVAPVIHGRWIEKENGSLTCIECGHITEQTYDEIIEKENGFEHRIVYPYFCGYCGAKMDGKEENPDGKNN